MRHRGGSSPCNKASSLQSQSLITPHVQKITLSPSRPASVNPGIAKPLYPPGRIMSTDANVPQAGEAPSWWAALPEPQAACETIENSHVMDLLEKTLAGPKHASRSFLLVDVRRTDWDGGTVATSINLPAQSFYQTRPVVYQLCKQAGIEKIIFYCGSSAGRGTRSARWMQDYLNQVGETGIKAIIMAGGIKGWHKAFGGRMMDNYDQNFWAAKA